MTKEQLPWRARARATWRQLTRGRRRARRTRWAVLTWTVGSALIAAVVWGVGGAAQGASRPLPKIEGFPPPRARARDDRPESGRVSERDLRASVERRQRRLREGSWDALSSGRRAMDREVQGDDFDIDVTRLPKPGAPLRGLPADALD